uniref:Uncharacterized protein n=1 Tax=Ditylenchus dipsaci TaxID=166011 RepID=A0A915DDD9_9BILA
MQSRKSGGEEARLAGEGEAQGVRGTGGPEEVAISDAQAAQDLNRRKTELPTTIQIKNFVYYQNKKEGLVNQLKLSNLRKHAQAYSAVPEDPDKPFVVHFEVSEDKKHWLLVWSTKRLRDVQKVHGR